MRDVNRRQVLPSTYKPPHHYNGRLMTMTGVVIGGAVMAEARDHFNPWVHEPVGDDIARKEAANSPRYAEPEDGEVFSLLPLIAAVTGILGVLMIAAGVLGAIASAAYHVYGGLRDHQTRASLLAALRNGLTFITDLRTHDPVLLTVICGLVALLPAALFAPRFLNHICAESAAHKGNRDDR